MRAYLVVAGLLFVGAGYFLVRPILGLVHFSARLAVWLVLIGVVIAATMLFSQKQNGLSTTPATYQSREHTLPYR
jgi:hypothetical protein